MLYSPSPETELSFPPTSTLVELKGPSWPASPLEGGVVLWIRVETRQSVHQNLNPTCYY